MAILGVVALLLSCSSVFLTPMTSILTMLSGLIVILASEKGLLVGGLAIMFNFWHILLQYSKAFSGDWLAVHSGLSLQSLFEVLFFIQAIYLGIVIWKWAFDESCYYPRINRTDQ